MVYSTSHWSNFNLNQASLNALNFIRLGKQVILLSRNSVIPKGKRIPATEEQVEIHDGNYAWLLGEHDLVIDVDPRNGGTESFTKLCKDHPLLYGYDFSPSLYTPRGGYHIYTRAKSLGDHSKVKLKEYPGIDFMRKGLFTVMSGSCRKGISYEYDPLFMGMEALPVLPLTLQKELKRASKGKQGRTTINKVSMALDDVPPDEYETWLKVGMALHSWRDDAIDLWDEWSRKSKKYKGEKEVRTKWESFTSSDDGITISTLFFMANEIRAKKKEAFDDWIMFAPSRAYYNLRTKESLPTEAFNTRMSSYVPPIETSRGVKRMPPTSWARQIGMIVTSRDEYAPDKSETTFIDKNGAMVLNAFDNDTVTKAKVNLDRLDERAFRFFKNHVAYICAAFGIDVDSDERLNPLFDNYYNLMDWMAWQVQRPGDKITWCPAIVGGQGVGKTALIEALEAMLGSKNVSKPSVDQIESRFNGWAVNCAVVVLDDLLIIGRDRNSTANKLKRGITNTTVHVERKTENGYDTPNRANYIAFTNHANFIPLEKTDRRWWIFHTPDLERVVEFTGKAPDIHMRNLYRVIEKYPEAMRAYFENWDIPVSFITTAKGIAPKTSYKRDMIGTSNVDSADGWDECLQVLEEGGEGCSMDAFIVPALRDGLFRMFTHLDLKDQDVARLSKIAGYKRKDSKIDISDRYTRQRVWYRGPLIDIEKRKALKMLRERSKDVREDDFD